MENKKLKAKNTKIDKYLLDIKKGDNEVRPKC